MAWTRVVTLSVALGLATTASVSARDLGNFGEVFPIAEPDLLAGLPDRLCPRAWNTGIQDNDPGMFLCQAVLQQDRNARTRRVLPAE